MELRNLFAARLTEHVALGGKRATGRLFRNHRVGYHGWSEEAAHDRRQHEVPNPLGLLYLLHGMNPLIKWFVTGTGRSPLALPPCTRPIIGERALKTKHYLSYKRKHFLSQSGNNLVQIRRERSTS